ncbi:MAG: hypothetical protein ACJ8F7_09045, partial [Gemmataceae bacterium]
MPGFEFYRGGLTLVVLNLAAGVLECGFVRLGDERGRLRVVTARLAGDAGVVGVVFSWVEGGVGLVF